MPERPVVLVVCVHNAVRSQMAAALLVHYAGDTCPYYPGKRYEDWQLDDPAGQPLAVLRTIRDEIDSKVRALLDQLHS